MLKQLFFPTNSKNISYSDESINILRLIRSENVGPRTFQNLIKFFGSASEALNNIAQLSAYGGRAKPIKVYSLDNVKKELDLLEKNKAHFITYQDLLYSPLLAQIYDFPPVLTYKGNINLLKCSKSIAVVGARNASINARNLTIKLATELVQHGYTIVSGLAKGIDTAAHSVSIKNTIAVVAGGLDYIYPPENKKLYEAIAEEGLLISEYPIGTQPLAKYFPQRNRLISGLSVGVLVVEANLSSGSLITAKTAIEQNREIFAIPGFPLDPRCQGTNKLLKEGATIVESVDDILSNLPYFTNTKKIFEFEETKFIKNNFNLENENLSRHINSQMRQDVINFLSPTSIDLEILVKEVDLPIQIVHMIILELELAGKVIRLPGNKISLIY